MTDAVVPEPHANIAGAPSLTSPPPPQQRKAGIMLAIVSLLLIAAFPRALSERLSDFPPTATVRSLKTALERIAAITPLSDVYQSARDSFSKFLQSNTNGH